MAVKLRPMLSAYGLWFYGKERFYHAIPAMTGTPVNTDYLKNRSLYSPRRAVSISCETNVTFPNSPYLNKFTVMGVVIVAKNL